MKKTVMKSMGKKTGPKIMLVSKTLAIKGSLTKPAGAKTVARAKMSMKKMNGLRKKMGGTPKGKVNFMSKKQAGGAAKPAGGKSSGAAKSSGAKTPTNARSTIKMFSKPGSRAGSKQTSPMKPMRLPSTKSSRATSAKSSRAPSPTRSPQYGGSSSSTSTVASSLSTTTSSGLRGSSPSMKSLGSTPGIRSMGSPLTKNKFGLIKANGSGEIPGLTQKEQGEWTGPFFFIQMADTQYGITDTLQPKDKNGKPTYSAKEIVEVERGMMLKAVDVINRLKPAFVVLCGDMIDAYPETSDKAKLDSQLQTVQSCLHKVDTSIPLVCCCGNHDMGNRPNFHTIKWYRSIWGHDYFSFWFKGVACVVLNSQLYKNPDDCKEYAEEQEEWLEGWLKTTKAAKPKAVVAFSHISPFIRNPNEKDGYFNWSEPSRTKVLDKMISVGCRNWFCGHYHRNSVGMYRNCLEVVTTGAVGVNIITNPKGNPLETTGVGGGLLDNNSCGLRIVKVNKNGRLSHEWKTFNQLTTVKKVQL